jgi:chromosome segregation ATPase
MDPHGHFDTDDAPAMRKFDGDPAVAEADLHRASQASIRADDALAEAEARADAIEQEPYDGSQEAEADTSQRMEVVQREIEALRQEVVEAEDELGRTHDYWVFQGYLPS